MTSSIFVPSSKIVAPKRLKSVELQEIIYRFARLHDKLCVLMKRTNILSSFVVIFFKMIFFPNGIVPHLFSFNFQLIFGPLAMLILAVFCFEALFVGMVDQNFKILLMALLFSFYGFHTYAVKVVLINSIVLAGNMV